ncbi:MAG: SEL1-like repeat protein [Acidobacteria bacterium]|nr:SEL1-like repeat protein [Acidobacteriota bacterium]
MTREIDEERQSQSFQTSESRGLFVGVNTFEDHDIGSLSFAVDDAVDLAFLFSCELELVSPERVHLALAGETKKPETADQLEWLRTAGAQFVEARANNLQRLAFELGTDTGKSGIWILTFSTHGFSDQGQDYLAALDSWLLRLAKTGISVTSLLDDIARATTPRRLLFLDACRRRLTRNTRGAGDTGMSDSLGQAISSATGLAVLNSTTLGGYSYEDPTLGNGVFTSAIIHGLRKGLHDDGSGFVTINSLAKYVNEEVQAWVKTKKPNDIEVSRGVVYTIEGQVGRLPLASNALDALTRREHLRRRQLALQRLRRNIGRIISGKHFDEIERLTRPDRQPENVMNILCEIEALDGTERSQRAFLHWFEQQAEPAWRSRFRNGLELMYGLQGMIDKPAAKQCFLDAAATGHPVPRLWLAWLRTTGSCSFERDAASSSSLGREDLHEVEVLAKQGDTDAAMVLGFALTDGISCEPNRNRAVELIRKAAQTGDTVAMNCLGYLGEVGMETESAHLFRKAAERGNAQAMCNLAGCYLDGKGVEQDAATAATWYQSAAERGHVAAMNSLAILYERGRGVARDYQIALHWYKKAADNGDAQAMANLGWMHLKGNGTRQDGNAAVTWFQRAVAVGNTFGMRSLGALYADGEHVPKDYGMATDLWRRAADLGDVDAMSTLGQFCETQGEPNLAGPWYQRAAELGDADAAYRLARLHEEGRGIEKDLVKAGEYFLFAAERSNVDAMTALARAYDSGSGVPGNQEEAAKWYRKAAERGDLSAMDALGWKYQKGLGVPLDPGEAVRWYLPAAEGGLANAMNNMGFMYESGGGVPKNPARAVVWYQKAAEQGHSYGMYNLGRCLMKGIGIPSDETKAQAWLQKAGEQGHPTAQELARKLQPRRVSSSVAELWKKLTS